MIVQADETWHCHSLDQLQRGGNFPGRREAHRVLLTRINDASYLQDHNFQGLFKHRETDYESQVDPCTYHANPQYVGVVTERKSVGRSIGDTPNLPTRPGRVFSERVITLFS